MHFKSKTIIKELPTNLRSIGVALCKPMPSLYTAISRAAFKNKKLRQALISHTCSELSRDCQKLVKKKKSVLRSNSIQDLKSFKWLRLERGPNSLQSSGSYSQLQYSKSIPKALHWCCWSNPVERKKSEDVSCAAPCWTLPFSLPYKKES